MSKTIVIVGVTGLQGGSVARKFLEDPAWKIRGITRDPLKPASKTLEAQGTEVVAGDLNDPKSLIKAFQGAHAIFAVTDFWAHIHDPQSMEKLKPGQLLNEYACDAEIQQGKNIANAAATLVDTTLELFIWSTLSNVKKWSKGKYTHVYHFDGKAAVTEYIEAELPKLAAKMSTLQVGLYLSNWKMPAFAPQKNAEGVYVLSKPGRGDQPAPFVNVPRDVGKFAYALSQASPRTNLLGASDLISMDQYMALWSAINNVPARYEPCTIAEFTKRFPFEFLGQEVGESAAYDDEFTWHGGDPTIVYPKDLGIETTTVEEYMKNEDWSSALA